ncbi:FadR/GntR family transcriptional regulator [Virgibacillus sp. C22-A2]|uniref:FadR/GntR family transcriptional regulator n=1 Tax=Virgibacillus tibetensis TaxID=3042313 RepID=A0ABU6KFN7_9BACI|nr:FadR/GntR family transcriptional regulator [Virgibacillus sp. C22-A2]
MSSLHADIVIDLKSKISSNILPEGQKLPSERELALQYEVSRNVIREAISVLRVEGLIMVQAGKGAYVTKPNPMMIAETIERIMKNYNTTLEDLLEVREGLEISIIKNVIKRATSEDSQILYKIYRDMEKNRTNVTQFAKLDLQFHTSLAESTKNPLYPVLLSSFMEMTQHVLFEFTRLIPESMVQAQEHHLALIKAIEEGDEDLAISTIISHMQVLREEIKVLKERNIIG